MIRLGLKYRSEASRIKILMKAGVLSLRYYEEQRGLSFTTVEAAAKDYLNTGEKLGIKPHLYFSPIYYATQLSFKPSTGLLIDYLTRGGTAGLDPSPLFQSQYYLRENEDVKKAGVNPLSHYLEYGYAEGRSPNALFDPIWYCFKYPDIDHQREDAFSHYLRFGAGEDRFPNGGFERNWYLSAYPEVAAFGEEALIHYLRVGEAAGLKPNPFFDPVAYAQKHGAEIEDGALSHYLFKSGLRAKERLGEFDPVEYIARNPGAEQDPLCHYLASRHVRRPEEQDRVHDSASCPSASVAELSLPQKVYLDDAYSLSSNDFDMFREARLRSSDQSKPDVSISVIVVADRDGACLSQTLQALDAVRVKDAEVIVIHRSEGIRAAQAESIAKQHVVTASESRSFIVLRAGDVPDLNFWQAARAGLDRGSDITVFDTFYRQDGRYFPVLLPGFNPLFLAQVGWDCARFAVSGRLFASWLRIADQGQFDGEAFVAFVIRSSGEMPAAATRHAAFPLVEIPDIRTVLDESRSRNLYIWYGKDEGRPVVRLTCSLVILTKDNSGLVKQLIDSALRTSANRIANIVVVPSSAKDENTRMSLDLLMHQRSTSIVWYDKSFNFSDKCNLGATHALGDIVVFLNDDIVPISDGWLDRLLEPFQSPRVGITGAQLLYPGGRSQHSGMFVTKGGVTGHTLKGADIRSGDYLAMCSLPRNVSVTTGAVLAIRRLLFEDLNGFDLSLANYIQDVDLCLRVRESGWDIVFCPHALLIHFETVTLSPEIDHPKISEARGREFQHFMRRWSRVLSKGDPYHNDSVDPADDSMRTLRLFL